MLQFFFKENLSIQTKGTPYFLLRRKTIIWKFKKTRNNFLKHAFCLGYFIFSISFVFFQMTPFPYFSRLVILNKPR